MNNLEYKLINFNKAVLRLKEAVQELEKNKLNDVIRDGVIQRFEFTYELAWKTSKEYLESIGIVDKTSPRAVIKEAYAQKLITDEKNWLLMLSDRNMTSHVYKEEMAKDIAHRICEIYVEEFEKLLGELK
jgi:nucleotidyltransferase substrate binding protein (TIGR01987 family)